MVLDMIAAMTALGKATHQLSTDPLLETGLSQVFLAVSPLALGSEVETDKIADEIVDSVRKSPPAESGKPLRYPGERVLRIRAENRRLGIPVDPSIWEQILAM